MEEGVSVESGGGIVEVSSGNAASGATEQLGELREEHTSAAAPAGQPYLLIVAADGGWITLPLPACGSVLIGRGPEVAVRIAEPAVSRRHARLDVIGPGTFQLVDLGSANGTVVGRRLLRGGGVPVRPGEPVLIGRTAITVHVPELTTGPLALAAGTCDAALPVGSEGEEPGVAGAVGPTDASRDLRRSEVAPVPTPVPSSGASSSPLPPRLARRWPAATPPTSQRKLSFAEVDDLVARAAPTMMSVLLLGETGVGKDVIAERLHRRSPRAAGPLLRLNCAGLSATLLESELFGYERGAFTGAAQAKQGLLEAAAGGTVFLDEIGEMPLEVQAKLLLAIEQRVARRLGATRSVDIDVRFISATHRDIEAEIHREQFRADFYYRINGITIRIPPLRDRKEEIDGLVAQFAEEASRRQGRARPLRFDAAARTRLLHHDWPGNVRELRSVVERAVLLADTDVVTPRELAAAGLAEDALPMIAPAPSGDAERDRVISALAECGGNQSRAARRLGMSRNTLIARIRRYGLARPHEPGAAR